MTDTMSKGEKRSKKLQGKSQADIPTEEIREEADKTSDLLKRMFEKSKPGNDLKSPSNRGK